MNGLLLIEDLTRRIESQERRYLAKNSSADT